MLFGDGGNGAGHPDAVGAHRDGDEITGLVLDLQAEGVGVFAPELEDVADLDTARYLDCSTAGRTRIAGADLSDIDHAVGFEIAAVDEVVDVTAGFVGSGDPR